MTRIKLNPIYHIASATLSRADSQVWAGARTPDGRELDEVRRRVRAEVRDWMAVRGVARCEIYASSRHGGCQLDAIELEAL